MDNYETDLENKDKLVALLKDHGFQLNINACGCCESPWITAWFKGEKILDSIGISIQMKRENGP